MKGIILIAGLLLNLLVTGQTLQNTTISGQVKSSGETLPFAGITLKNSKDSTFVMGTLASEAGRFQLTDVKSGNYLLQVSLLGFQTKTVYLQVGSLSPFLDLGTIEISEESRQLQEVVIAGQQAEGVSNKMDRKIFYVEDNISQSGGSVLQALKNLPGVTADQDGKVLIRGSDKVAVLLDGKQTALTGFGNQASLDNIPASSIEKIEIIQNPSAKYDANGNAGIINIIYKKNQKEGFNGKIGISAGLGALWVKKANLPGIRPQYQATPKINPSLSLNYRKNKTNLFFQGDYLHTPTLNKNEFVDRFYENGDVVRQQTKRNRNTDIVTAKAGIDYTLSPKDMITVSGMFSSEKIIDRGDEPFYNQDLTGRIRLWKFLEDELKTTVTASASYQHHYEQPGHLLSVGFNYTFHREDEKYFFTNILPDFTGEDAFKLLSDENVADFNLDYVRPLRYGRIEGGLKLRRRYIPTNMQFFPGLNSPIDSLAGGWANYSETIPAVYGNYVFENNHIEVEAGIRVEYVDLNYKVNPNHPTYKSNGYQYTQPFPNIRFAWKIDEKNKFSLFYNRRVDRPNEVDIRIFPKYDDAEIIKVGNPALKPQFTNTFELGYKTSWSKGYLYAALYSKQTQGTIARIGTTLPGSTLIYNVFQNAGKSSNRGVEFIGQHQISPWFTLNLSANLYKNTIDAFTVENQYPVPTTFSAPKTSLTSGNIKANGLFKVFKKTEVQVAAMYLAADLIPQGKTGARFSVDAGVKRQVGKGEFLINASDLFNTLVIQKQIQGEGFHYTSKDYYETQVIRIGYNFKF